jgi:hypothetical protein
MKNKKNRYLVFGALIGLGLTSMMGAVDSVQNGARSVFSGLTTFAAGLKLTGFSSTMSSGTVMTIDRRGISSAWPTTDASPTAMRIVGMSASPISTASNQTGSDLSLAAGDGITVGLTTVSNCGAGDTVTVTINGTAQTCTRDATTDSSTLFTCGATDAAMATNVAACLTQKAGVDACAGTGCTLFTGVAGTFYVYPDNSEGPPREVQLSTNDATAVAVTNGSRGEIVFPSDQNVSWNVGTATGQILAGLGSASAPTHSFKGDANTGLYSPVDNSVGLTANGTAVLTATSSLVSLPLTLGLASGTVSVPTLAFTADADGTGTGFYRAGGNSIGVAANGVQAFSFDAGGLNVSNGYFIYADGSGNAATPGIAFQGDGNTGVDNSAADTISVIGGGAIGLQANASGVNLLNILQADLTAGSCTANQIRLDTGGATAELCYCQATNTWYCVSFTTVTGPTD